MKKRLSIDVFSNLLFGEINEDRVNGFLEGNLADQYSAKETLGHLRHRELTSVNRELGRSMVFGRSHAIYTGSEALYRSNGHAPNYSQALLFRPELKELVLEPFTGLIEAANPGYKFEQGPGELRLAFRNLKHNDRERARPRSTGVRRL